jgi:tetratricopeptide (TPR) repeat protein
MPPVLVMRSIRWSAAALIAMGVLCARAAAPDTQWLDTESRIQYGYYTEDVRALEQVAESLETDTSEAALRQYYLGLARYRLALLQQPRHANQAKEAAERCVSNLDIAAKDASDTPEALALEAACYRLLAELKPVSSPYFGLRVGNALHRALALAPKNPRVLLLVALDDYELHREGRTVVAELRTSVSAFEHEREGIERPPSWGAAEAYAFLGRSLLEQGDAIGARGALEHALLLVPDFSYAHRLMARITAG